MIDVAAIGEKIDNDIKSNTITLPTLPEVALKVREAIEDENSTIPDIVNIVSQDAALSARLLQVANSAVYRGASPIENLQVAISRMGNKLVRSLVISLAMKQIFQATSTTLDEKFREAWEDSIQVAAISRVLAADHPSLDNEQAMLAGLIHNIGILPLLTYLDANYDLDTKDENIEQVLEELTPKIGNIILSTWNFPTSIASIPIDCMDANHDSGDKIDYCDIVLVARLQNQLSKGDMDAASQWGNIPAFDKVGLEPEIVLTDTAGPAEDIANVKSMLGA